MDRRRLTIGLVLLALGAFAFPQSSVYHLRPLPPPHEYGTILMDRSSTESGQKPVTFAHWTHRMEYTCRVCHFELEFMMQNGATEITEKANQQGRFCGACHDGETAFGHTEKSCSRCHTGEKLPGNREFKRRTRRLPEAPFGNEIDWAAALRDGDITPRQSIFEDDYQSMPLSKELSIESRWMGISPARFTHKDHKELLDCADCHPDIFAIKKDGTDKFDMNYILEGKFCGACHLTVAFPVNDCVRCHPTMRGNR